MGLAVVDCDRNTEWSLMKRRRRKEGEKDIAKLRTASSYASLQASASASGTNVRMGFNGPRHSAMVQWVKGVYERLRDLKCPITTRTASQVPTDLRRQPQKNGSEIHTPVFKEANPPSRFEKLFKETNSECRCIQPSLSSH